MCIHCFKNPKIVVGHELHLIGRQSTNVSTGLDQVKIWRIVEQEQKKYYFMFRIMLEELVHKEA